jgi:hypothetical protein
MKFRREFWAIPLAEKEARISLLEKYLQRHGEKLWPSSYHTYVINLRTANRFMDACTALQTAYDFEPKYRTFAEWRQDIHDIEYWAKKSGEMNFSCRVNGLSI